jgi:signal transduction histidine kinase
MISLLEAIPQQYSTIVLLGLLVLALVVAFKVMELVFETLTVSALSAVFYVAYTAFLGGGLSEIVINDLLLFAFLGAGFYMTYSFLSSAYTLAARIIHVPYSIVMFIYRGSRRLFGAVTSTASKVHEKGKQKAEERKKSSDRGKSGGNDEGGESDEDDEDDSNNTVKEVVLRSDDEEEE